MAAPTYVSFGSTTFNTSSEATKTVSITTAVGDRIVVVTLGESGDGALTTAPTGGSLTYTQVANLGTASSSSRAIAWTATATAAATFTVTIARPTTSSGLKWGGMVWVWRASDGFGAVGAPTVGSTSNSVTLTTTAANSALCVASSDWNAVDGATRTRRTVNSSTGTENIYGRDSAAYTWYAQRYDDAGAAGSKTAGYSAPSGQNSAIIAVEVLGTASAPTASGTGEISQSHTLTSTGTKTVSGTGVISQTDALTSTGTKQASGTAAISQSHTLTSAGGRLVDGTGAISQSSTLTSTGVKMGLGTASISQTDSVTSSGTKTAASGTGSISQADSVTGSGSAVGSTTTYFFPSGAGWTPTGEFSDSAPLNIGTLFGLTAAASITGLRFWAPEATTFTAQLWVDGVKTQETTGVSAAADVWTTVTFTSATAGNTSSVYLVAVLQPTGTVQYTGRAASFGTAGVSTLVEVGPVFSNNFENGLFTTSTSAYPGSHFNSTWYGIDAIVEAGAAPPEEKSGTGSISQTSDVTSTGSKAASGTGSISQSDTVTSSGGKTAGSGTGGISQSHTVIGSGAASVQKSGTGSISQSSTVSSSGSKMAIGGGVLDFYGEITGSGSSSSSTSRSGTGSISQSHTVTSTGSKSVGGLGSISQSSTVTGFGSVAGGAQRNILITGVTEPTTGWLTTEMQSGWASTDPTAAWATAEAAAGWTTAEPAVSAQWTTTEPGSGTITTEPVLSYTVTEPTI
jgi:fibronectin-binding autotransporter adhesin